ncbi:hypothetical protein PQX77_001979 [Marasmius sp. AFHP31]|nr:hypothetical protein PQX77_001979 [Marasmius sp. AFHP31]
MANPSFVLHAADNVSLEDLPIRERELVTVLCKEPLNGLFSDSSVSSEHDVIIEIKKNGICGSDVHFYVHGGTGPVVVKEPMVLGGYTSLSLRLQSPTIDD